MRNLNSLVLAASLLFVGVEVAHGQHVDVMGYQKSGQLQIAGFDFDFFSFVDKLVFEGELEDPDADGDFFGDDPGWTGVSDVQAPAILPPGSDNLPANTDVFLDVVLGLGGRSLSFWDGTGAVNFGATPDAEVLEFFDFIGGVSVLDGSSGLTDIALGTTSASGLLHQHIDFILFGDDSLTPDAATEGIYLVEGQLHVDGLDPSASFFILFGTFTEDNELVMEEAIELAEGWVESNLVPEPSSLLLVGSGLAGLLALGRKRD